MSSLLWRAHKNPTEEQAIELLTKFNELNRLYRNYTGNDLGNVRKTLKNLQSEVIRVKNAPLSNENDTAINKIAVMAANRVAFAKPQTIGRRGGINDGRPIDNGNTTSVAPTPAPAPTPEPAPAPPQKKIAKIIKRPQIQKTPNPNPK